MEKVTARWWAAIHIVSRYLAQFADARRRSPPCSAPVGDAGVDPLRVMKLTRHAKRQHAAWATTGAREMLPGSDFARQLADLGIRLQDDGEGERILPSAIVENFVRADTGELIAVNAASTCPIALPVKHALVAKTKRHSFMIS